MQTGVRQSDAPAGFLKSKRKKARRHSYHSISKIKDPQKALLVALLCYYGGSTKLARRLSAKLGRQFIRQVPDNWVTRGYVPLPDIWNISQAMRVSPYALNYEGYSKIAPTELTFKEVIASCKFLPIEVRREIKKKVKV